MQSKPVFVIDDYPPSQGVVMHCKTKEEASDFLEYLNSHGRTWCDGRLYTDEETHFDRYTENTCYNFNAGAYGYIGYYRGEGYTILEYGEFDWSSPLDTDVSYESFLNIISV